MLEECFGFLSKEVIRGDNKGGEVPMLLEAGLKVFLFLLPLVLGMNLSRGSRMVGFCIDVRSWSYNCSISSVSPSFGVNPMLLVVGDLHSEPFTVISSCARTTMRRVVYDQTRLVLKKNIYLSKEKSLKLLVLLVVVSLQSWRQVTTNVDSFSLGYIPID
jgi:hypothetical protein